MTYAEFDQKMQDHHALVVQQAAMRRLIAECTDRDFLEDYLLPRIELQLFKAGDNAKEFFDASYETYSRFKNLKIA